VGVVKVAARPVTVYDEYVGQTEAANTIELRAQVTGLLERQVAPDGAYVRKGDVLYEIDPRPFQSAVAQAEANVQNARAALVNAQQTLDRYNELVGQGFISKLAYQNAQAQQKQSTAQLAAQQALLRDARINLGYTQLRAPRDGYLSESQVRAGALITAQQTLLNTLYSSDPMFVYFSVSEDRMAALQRALQGNGEPASTQASGRRSSVAPGVQAGGARQATGAQPGGGQQAAGVQQQAAQPQQGNAQAQSGTQQQTAGQQQGNTQEGTDPSASTAQHASGAQAVNDEQPHSGQQRPGSQSADAGDFELELPDGSHYHYRGQLNFVDVAVNQKTGTLQARVSVPNPERALRPGMFVRLRVPSMQSGNALTVPQKAVTELQGLKMVYVIGTDGKPQQRQISADVRAGSDWVVEKGLQPGEMVIVEGLPKIQMMPNAPVKPVVVASEPSPPGATGNAPATGEAPATQGPANAAQQPTAPASGNPPAPASQAAPRQVPSSQAPANAPRRQPSVPPAAG
jgi:multidrug efflux pump subunit AcrA (membrane-fusion protein)